MLGLPQAISFADGGARQTIPGVQLVKEALALAHPQRHAVVILHIAGERLSIPEVHAETRSAGGLTNQGSYLLHLLGPQARRQRCPCIELHD